MEKIKFHLTVSRVFLFVCFLIILLLSYLLVIEHDKVVDLNDKETITFSKNDALDIASKLYKETYEYVNNSLFINNENLGYGCMEVDTNNLNNYFTNKAINDIRNSLLDNGEIYYDCNEFYHRLDLNSIFGVTDQGIRELEIELFNENMIVAKGTLNNEFEKDRYIIFIKENNKWLIDMYE